MSTGYVQKSIVKISRTPVGSVKRRGECPIHFSLLPWNHKTCLQPSAAPPLRLVKVINSSICPGLVGFSTQKLKWSRIENPEAEVTWLSPRMIFPYLYEKKLSNMKIENFKKPQKFYKKINNHPRCNPSTRQGPCAT